MVLKSRILAGLLSMLVITAVCAHEFKLGEIQIAHPYARATVTQQTSGAAYLGLENKGKTTDKLLKVESNVAKSVEIHNMEMVGDVMKMREVDGLELKAGSKISMSPGGGYHIMLIGLKQPLKAGDKFPLTLTFEKAGKIEVVVYVDAEK
ncbi:copper(I)-binding protein [Oxalobacteraceae bacterium GrIS 2.11]